jgi:hypothetical protein
MTGTCRDPLTRRNSGVGRVSRSGRCGRCHLGRPTWRRFLTPEPDRPQPVGRKTVGGQFGGQNAARDSFSGLVPARGSPC